MRRLDGDAKSVRSLLGGAKFAIDYYQREYRWETKQVAELIDDLAEKFLKSHEPGNERSAVEQYGHYFLGCVRGPGAAGAARRSHLLQEVRQAFVQPRRPRTHALHGRAVHRRTLR